MTDLIATLLLTGVLLRLSIIDSKTLRLPDIWTLPLIAAGLTHAALTGEPSIMASLIGGFTGFALFWAIGAWYYRRTGIDGLGLGDAKLFAASGTWLGYSLLPHVLLIAALSGLAFAALRRHNPHNTLPFGPWLAFGFLSVWAATRYLNHMADPFMWQ